MAADNISYADDVPPEPAPAAEPVQPEGYFSRKMTDFGKNMDLAHELIEQDILKEAIRFDDFFGKANTEYLRPTSYELRWRNSLRMVHDGNELKYGTGLQANMVLSKISERLHLSITGDEEAAPLTPSLPEDPGNLALTASSGPPPVSLTRNYVIPLSKPQTWTFSWGQASG
jgi:hypothetical protein